MSIRLPEGLLSKDDYVRLPSYEKEHYVKNIIRKTVQLNPNGITANQLAKALDLDPRIVDKHLTVMLHTGEVYTVQYDKTTVYLPNTRALHAVLEDTFKVDENTEFHVYQLRNRLGDFVYIQERRRRGYSEDIGAGIQLPLDKFPDFVEYLKKTQVEMMKRSG